MDTLIYQKINIFYSEDRNDSKLDITICDFNFVVKFYIIVDLTSSQLVTKLLKAYEKIYLL